MESTHGLPKVAKVEAFRVDTKIVHRGIFVTTDEVGAGLYRLACQGRNVRFLSRAADDQTQPITCKKCGR